ncbi:hypothetical protein JCM3765_000190 [Sporobolomyces pararoseus]
MLSPLPLVVSIVASFAFHQSTTVSALPTSEAPTCAIKCFQKKIEEADYIAPGAKGLRGLCKTPNWVKAYNNCIDDNCKEDYVEAAYLFGVNVCTGKITTSAAHGDSSSSRKLSKCNDDQCSASTSASATLISSHPASCTCTESSHAPGATQVYVGSVPTSSSSANITSSATGSPTVATASIASPTTTSGATSLSIGVGALITAVLAAVLH